MNEQQTATNETACSDNERATKVIRIFLNNAPVEILRRRVTGLVIKQSAIEQGVRIELDFILFIERGSGQTQVVGDGDKVTVRNGSRFNAIPHDDNS